MTLSILIPSTVSRQNMLTALLLDLYRQIDKCGAEKEVEILTEIDNGETPTGTKRNTLLSKATGKYVCAIDSDDQVSKEYISLILNATKEDVDAVAIAGWMTTDLENRVDWFISKDFDYVASVDKNGKEIYLRWHNHISVVRREIAIQFKFPDIFRGEDYLWSKEIHDSGLIKIESKIDTPLYHYDFRSNK